MQKRTRNVLLGAIASGGFALSMAAGQLLRHGLETSATPAGADDGIVVILLVTAIAVGVFLLGARLGRIRSGWLASLLLSSSLAWHEALAATTAPLLLTAAVTLGGGALLWHHQSRETRGGATPPRVAILASLAVPWVLLVYGFLWFRAPQTSTPVLAQILSLPLTLATGLLPWSLMVIPVGLWLREQRPLPTTTYVLVLWSASGLVFFSLAQATPEPVWLPCLPALALLAGLVLGPGPEGLWPRRLVRLNLEIVAAAGMLAAFVILSLLVSPVEDILPAGWIARWGNQLSMVREQGTPAMVLSLAGLVLAALVIGQARGAHWLRASFPLALLLLLLQALLP